MLTAKEAFKVGFLSRCADMGLNDEETHELVKKALDLGIGSALGALGTLAEKPLSFGLTAAMIAPPAIGAGMGYGLSQLTDADDTDVDELRKSELIDEYRRLADQIRQKKIRLNRGQGL